MTPHEPPPYPGDDPQRDLPDYGTMPASGGAVPPGTGGFPPPVPGAYPQRYPQDRQQNPKALWSMILGIVSIPLLCLCSIGIIPGVAAIILGVLAKGEIERSAGTQDGHGQAVAGLICGAVGSALNLLYLILIIGLGVPGWF